MTPGTRMEEERAAKAAEFRRYTVVDVEHPGTPTENLQSANAAQVLRDRFVGRTFPRRTLEAYGLSFVTDDLAHYTQGGIVWDLILKAEEV